jgi:hypothetical protein
VPINVTCPQCGALLPAPDEFAGRAIRCGGCQGVVPVPAAAITPVARPVARAIARPIARPASGKSAEPEAEPARPARTGPNPMQPVPDHSSEPVRPARRRTEDDSPTEDRPRRRPLAIKRPPSILTNEGRVWLMLLLVASGLCLLLFTYAVLGGRAAAS